MQDLLKNQDIVPRSDSHNYRQDAEAAVIRLRALKLATRLPEPVETVLVPVASPVRQRRRPSLFVLCGLAVVGLALAVSFILPQGPSGILQNPLVTGTGIDPIEGSGYVQVNRDKDVPHTIHDGDTLAEIAYFYGVDYSTLAVYNNLKNPDLLLAGQTLLIPSEEHEKSLRTKPEFEPVALKSTKRSAKVVSPQLLIKAAKQYDGAAITAHFSIEAPQDQQFSSYTWDLGNGKMAFRESPYWSYEQPGTYTVKLRAKVKGGAELVSNPLYIDVPHPGSFQGSNQQFITLSSLQESFRLEGEIENIGGFQSVDEAPISKVGQDGQVGVYQVNKPGFYAINLINNEMQTTTYLYASPIASVHSDRSDMNWYRTQFNTGTLSNCGPTSVSMAYAWAKGGYLPVSSVRQAVGWRGNGSTSYEELTQVLSNNDVSNQVVKVRKAADLFQIVDNGNIAIVLINTGAIRRSNNGLADLYGRYYNDVVGHYVVLKGYSTDHKYIIVYDPIPSDWSSNSFRYGDGISMSGRNRYYAIEDVMAGLRTDTVLEIQR